MRDQSTQTNFHSLNKLQEKNISVLYDFKENFFIKKNNKKWKSKGKFRTYNK